MKFPVSGCSFTIIWHHVLSKILLPLLFLVFFFTLIFLAKEQLNHRLQLKFKHLVVRPSQEYVLDSEIKILVLKILQLRLVLPLDWKVIVILWLSSFETNHLQK